jgi:site-specific recombinase XerD
MLQNILWRNKKQIGGVFVGTRKIISTAELGPHITALVGKLKEMGYSQSLIRRMQSVWKVIPQYEEEHGEQPFDAECCRKIAQEYFGHCQDKYSASDVNRALSMLSDFIEYGMVFQQSFNHGQDFTIGFKELFDKLLHHLKIRNFSESSIKSWRSRLYRLENFLLNSDVAQFKDVTLPVLNRYLETLALYAPTTALEAVRELKCLCDYALAHGYHTQTFSSALPCVKNTYQQRLPSVFTPEETKQLLDSVDRSNPTGKRNYAILLLAARLGLRISDIRALEFDSIDWHKKSISIIQQKTKQPLELPLPDDVGWAIIDYLKHGRPESACKKLFIQHRVPYNEFTSSMNFIAHQMRKSGIKSPGGRRCGMQALRHGLASAMLQNGVELSVISQTLGHADIHSTEVYLRIGLNQLRECALEVEL